VNLATTTGLANQLLVTVERGYGPSFIDEYPSKSRRSPQSSKRRHQETPEARLDDPHRSRHRADRCARGEVEEFSEVGRVAPSVVPSGLGGTPQAPLDANSTICCPHHQTTPFHDRTRCVHGQRRSIAPTLGPAFGSVFWILNSIFWIPSDSVSVFSLLPPYFPDSLRSAASPIVTRQSNLPRRASCGSSRW